MSIDIVRGRIRNYSAIDELLDKIKEISDNDEGTLYLGYPLQANVEDKVTLDALLVTKKIGLIAFIIAEDDRNAQAIMDENDSLLFQIKHNFTKYPSLRKRSELSFKPHVITLISNEEVPDVEEDVIVSTIDKVLDVINEDSEFTDEIFSKLNEALQKVTNIKPKKKRENVKNDLSFGGKIKSIEKEIANLDQWQKKAAFEIPDGPQRIRGLAGSGKTIVLALKVAYLHSQFPDWNIAITFYTRSLKQQLETLIRQFAYEFMNDEPDWEKIHVLHSWGTADDGIYSTACNMVGVTPMNYSVAKSKYGRGNEFSGICKDLLTSMDEKFKPIYDAILIDEAQDFPSPFFRIIYKLTKMPKRITWAYDELQSLSEVSMPSLKEMFGVDENGELNIRLENKENEALRDIILPKCYRNPHWALTIAHALGFGIYRDGPMVQMFENLEIWEEIGYKIISGNLDFGKHVKLMRSKDATPVFFEDLLSAEECIQVHNFDDRDIQYKWVAEQIQKNIEEDELDPDDILIVFPDAYYAKRDFIAFREYTNALGIDSVLAGVSTSLDVFRVKGSITCASIYRAKGNEAPMVYILNSERCNGDYELIKLRNTLFTAITRSRAWVRVCGSSEYMDTIEAEIKCCIEKDYILDFKFPTFPEIQKMKRVNRERTQEEKRKITEANEQVRNILNDIENGELDFETIPGLEALLEIYKRKVDDYEE